MPNRGRVLGMEAWSSFSASYPILIPRKGYPFLPLIMANQIRSRTCPHMHGSRYGYVPPEGEVPSPAHAYNVTGWLKTEHKNNWNCYSNHVRWPILKGSFLSEDETTSSASNVFDRSMLETNIRTHLIKVTKEDGKKRRSRASCISKAIKGEKPSCRIMLQRSNMKWVQLLG